MVDLVAKQVKDGDLKAGSLRTMPLLMQDWYFAQVYGRNNHALALADNPSASGILNMMLAIEQIGRFNDVCFADWEPLKSRQAKNPRWDQLLKQDQKSEKLLDRLGILLGYSDEQTLWLHHGFRAVPDWSKLTEEGPWTQAQDGLARFLVECLSYWEKPRAMSAEDYIAEHEEFVRMVRSWRRELPGSFLPEAVVLVEGQTEVLLMPHFARLLKIDLPQLGVMFAASSGARKIGIRYKYLSERTNLPIAIVADADAEAELAGVRAALRKQDKFHLWPQGEIEDTFAPNVLLEHLNKYLHASGARNYITPSELDGDERRTVLLDKLWRRRGLGDFDKLGFAGSLVNTMIDANQVPPDVVKTIQSIETLVKR